MKKMRPFVPLLFPILILFFGLIIYKILGYKPNLYTILVNISLPFVLSPRIKKIQKENGIEEQIRCAMDLVASAENIIVAMMHTNKHGDSKILKRCSLPLTGVGCVTKVVTNLAVLEVKDNQFHLLERAPGVSVEDIQKATEGTLVVNGEIPEMDI